MSFGSQKSAGTAAAVGEQTAPAVAGEQTAAAVAGEQTAVVAEEQTAVVVAEEQTVAVDEEQIAVAAEAQTAVAELGGYFWQESAAAAGFLQAVFPAVEGKTVVVEAAVACQ